MAIKYSQGNISGGSMSRVSTKRTHFISYFLLV